MGRFSTKVLDRSLAEKRARLERLRKDRVNEAMEALSALAGQMDFDDAYLFGSITKKGKFGNKSDVDIGFVGLKGRDVLRATTFLSGELGINVDVVQLEGYRLARKIMQEGMRWKRIK